MSEKLQMTTFYDNRSHIEVTAVRSTIIIKVTLIADNLSE